MVVDVFYLVLKGLEIPFFIQKLYLTLGSKVDDLVGIMLRGISANPQDMIKRRE